jgi:uncharacterized heparinase superfamily protein
MHLFNKIVRLFHTVKYLKLKQILGRVIIFLPRFITIHKKHPRIKELNKLNSYVTKSKSTSDYKTFIFLSESHNLNIVGWDDESISKLWRYNLHYFDYLVQEKTTDEDIKLQFDCIENWLDKNKFGKGTGWEPYPTSIRIINWIKWHWKTNGLSDRAKLSLWNQVLWLASRPEYHLLGNHLFINAKALCFASVFFEQTIDSKIYKIAIKIIQTELKEQFLADGAHFELSPMYHNLAMEDLLDLYQLKKYLPSSFPSQEIQEKFLLGMNWLSNMNYCNGELAHFNDCANGIAPTIEELDDLGKKLGLNWSLNSDIKFNYFKESGFVVFKDDNIHLIADIGNIGPDYLPGHAHADSLSFELALKGQRVIVNSGTGEYGVSEERLRQRSTSAHSTIEIDDKSSSEVWSGFRVARRARVTAVEIIDRDNKLEFAAVHDGYTRIASKPIHKRKWKVNDRCLEILDEVSGSQNSVQLRYYLHPDIQIEMLDDGIHLCTSKEKLAKFRTDQYVQVVDTTYHDRFGTSKKNKCLLITGITPFRSKVSISWDK